MGLVAGVLVRNRACHCARFDATNGCRTSQKYKVPRTFARTRRQFSPHRFSELVYHRLYVIAKLQQQQQAARGDYASTVMRQRLSSAVL